MNYFLLCESTLIVELLHLQLCQLHTIITPNDSVFSSHKTVSFKWIDSLLLTELAKIYKKFDYKSLVKGDARKKYGYHGSMLHGVHVFQVKLQQITILSNDVPCVSITDSIKPQLYQPLDNFHIIQYMPCWGWDLPPLNFIFLRRTIQNSTIRLTAVRNFSLTSDALSWDQFPSPSNQLRSFKCCCLKVINHTPISVPFSPTQHSKVYRIMRKALRKYWDTITHR